MSISHDEIRAYIIDRFLAIGGASYQSNVYVADVAKHFGVSPTTVRRAASDEHGFEVYTADRLVGETWEARTARVSAIQPTTFLLVRLLREAREAAKQDA